MPVPEQKPGTVANTLEKIKSEKVAQNCWPILAQFNWPLTINSPTIQKRKFQTSVLTNDGYTVTLGGLIRDNNTKNNSGVPFLKNIPLFGNLFRDDGFNDKRTELIVLLVPHVMRNQAETQAVVDSLLDQLKSPAASIERAPASTQHPQ